MAEDTATFQMVMSIIESGEFEGTQVTRLMVALADGETPERQRDLVKLLSQNQQTSATYQGMTATVGSRVQLYNLTPKTLNNQVGTVLELVGRTRWRVELDQQVYLRHTWQKIVTVPMACVKVI